jgi:acetyltransferase-like isoleucine patch superfamily enzyme
MSAGRTVSRLLWAISRAADRIGDRWRLAMYSGLADGGPDVRFLGTARVLNSRGDPASISIGANTIVGGELFTFGHGGRIRLGEWCYVGAGTRIWSAESVEIGDRVLISHGVNIHDCNSHPRSPEARHRQFVSIARQGHPRQIDGIASAPVRIGDDAWIGFNAVILKGVTIGARSIVAAGSIVTRDVPADSLFIADRVAGSLE